MIENIVEKEENAGSQHFLLFPQCFQKVFLPPVRKKSSLCGKGLTVVIYDVAKGANIYKIKISQEKKKRKVSPNKHL